MHKFIWIAAASGFAAGLAIVRSQMKMPMTIPEAQPVTSKTYPLEDNCVAHRDKKVSFYLGSFSFEELAWMYRSSWGADYIPPVSPHSADEHKTFHRIATMPNLKV